MYPRLTYTIRTINDIVMMICIFQGAYISPIVSFAMMQLSTQLQYIMQGSKTMRKVNN